MPISPSPDAASSPDPPSLPPTAPSAPATPRTQRESLDLRAELRRIRAALDEDEQRDAARQVARRLLELDLLAGTGTLGTYLPTDGEMDPNLALDELRARGWTIALPIVEADRSMRFARWDADARLVPNRFGIDEPEPPLEAVSFDQLDVVLVPCVAVDLEGNRLGFGAGFYDRAFARPDLSAADIAADDPNPDATTPPRRAVLVGVVHDIQVVDRIEPDPWDVPMDLIVTGARVLSPGGPAPRR